MIRLVLLPCWLGCGLLVSGLFVDSIPALSVHTASARSSWSLRHYRKLRRNIFRRYRAARRNRYREPCRAWQKLGSFKAWLKKLQRQSPNLALRRSHRRYLQARIKRYLRYTRYQRRYTWRRCRRFWKGEFKRLKQRWNQRCKKAMGPSLQEDGAGLWVGVTPWAFVYINGKLCGTSPFYARIRPGTYKLRLVYPPGKDSFTQTVTLRGAGKPTLVVRQMRSLPPAPKKFKNLLAPKQLRWVLRRHRSSMKSCGIYAPAVKSVALSWEINAAGRVRQVRWERPSQAPPRFKKCIMRALGRIRFPSGNGVARIRSYEIKLRSSLEP